MSKQFRSAFPDAIRALGYPALFVACTLFFGTATSRLAGLDWIAAPYLRWPLLAAASGLVYGWIQSRITSQLGDIRNRIAFSSKTLWGFGTSTAFAVAMCAFLFCYGEGDLRLSTRPGLWQPDQFLKLVCMSALEEWLFRGLVFGSLMTIFSRRISLLAQAGLFASMHLFNSGQQPPVLLLSHFTLAMLLGQLRERTGGVWAGVVLHSVSNLFIMSLPNVDSALFGGWGVASGVRIEIAGFVTAPAVTLARSVFYLLACGLLCPQLHTAARRRLVAMWMGATRAPRSHESRSRKT